MKQNSLSLDLDYILKKTRVFWEALRNQRIFITGGTGFFGCWLLESFVWANNALNLNAEAWVLTRNPVSFSKKYPHLSKQACLKFYEGDVRDFVYPIGNFSHLIHAATDVSLGSDYDPIERLNTIIEGTQRVLAFASTSGVKNFLLVSSGAVYGKQPLDCLRLKEDHACQFDFLDVHSTYGIGKSTAEHLAVLYAKKYGMLVKIARCFSFIGAYLPLDSHLAVSNFIHDGLNGKSIAIKGDGSSLRSYLYAADLAVWLWTILFKGESLRPYNVGSDEIVSMTELANAVSMVCQEKPVITMMKSINKLPERYLPDVDRAKKELNLVTEIHLKQAIQSTCDWFNRVKEVDLCK